jgi:hypothetical protein
MNKQIAGEANDIKTSLAYCGNLENINNETKKQMM